MKKQSKAAKILAKVAEGMANKACGAASGWGAYQPREPKKLSK